jgi:hypothetical protein
MSIRLQQGQKGVEETIKQLSTERMVPIEELSWSTEGQKGVEETIKQLSTERMVPIEGLSWSTEGDVCTIHIVSSRSGKSEQESFPQKRIEECVSAGTTGERWGMELNLTRMFQRLEAAEAGNRF